MGNTRVSRGLESASPEREVKAPREVKLLASMPLCLLACLFVMPGASATQSPPKGYAATFYEPFKGPPKKADDFTLIGADAGQCVKFEPEGLRITMPPGKTRAPTGVATSFGLKGDFEITVRYEIFQEPDPADAGTFAVGTRISLRVHLNAAFANEAAIRRKVTPSQPVHVLAYRALRQAGDSEADKVENAFPVKEKTGQFRLVRSGADVAYYLAEGLNGEFRLLTTFPFGADDVKEVQIYGQCSSSRAALDARFTDLHIGAAALPRRSAPSKIDKGKEPPAPPKVEKVSEPTIPTKDYAQTYFQSFKGSGARPAGWDFTAAAAEEWVHFEPTGLRLTMPAGSPGERRAAGIESVFGVKGDFEITLSFEFLKEPAPAADGKFATRLGLAVALDTPLLDTPHSEVATLNRSLSIQGVRSFSAWMRTREHPEGVKGGGSTTATTGRLRYVRSGDELFFLASAGADQPFALLKKNRFGAADLKRVAITGATGHEQAMLDGRLTDFSIRADAIPGAPAADAAAAPPAPVTRPREHGRRSLVAGLLVGLTIAFIGILAVGVRFFLRRRAGAASQTPTDTGRTAVSFACPKCAKAFKAKVELAGKKVKCGRCGTVVNVPLDADRLRD